MRRTTPAAGPTSRIGALRRDLRYCSIDGLIYCVMLGVGETYFPKFVFTMDPTAAGQVLAGLVATAPMALGAVLQLIVPWMVAKLRSNRAWVLVCATVQAASFLPLVAVAALGLDWTWAVFLTATIYWAAAMGAAPAWNTWMAAVIPPQIRARYFGVRSRLCHLGTLSALVFAGVVLESFGSRGLTAFVVLFGLAAVCRFVCLYFLASTTEPTDVVTRSPRLTARDLLHRLSRGNDGRLLVFMLTMQVGVQIGQPFLNPYMLQHANLPRLGGPDQPGGLAYSLLLGTALLARALAPPTLGRIAARHGAMRLVWIGAVGLVPLTALWTVSTQFAYLLVIQFVSGTFWAAYELGTFLMMMESIPERERTRMLTSFNLWNSAAILVGSSIGAQLLSRLGESPGAYWTIFGVSLACRASAIVLLARVTKGQFRVQPLGTTPIAVRPNAGAVDAPVPGSLRPDDPDA